MKNSWLEQYKQGGKLIKRADGSYSQRGLWDNIRANAGSGKKPTEEMLKQEKKIRAAEKVKNGKKIDKSPESVKKSVFEQYPILNKVAPYNVFNIDYAKGEDLNKLRQYHHNPEYISPGEGETWVTNAGITVPGNRMMIAGNDYDPVTINNLHPGQYTTVVDTANKSRKNIVDMVAADFVSHALKGNIPEYDAAYKKYDSALRRKYGNKHIDQEGTTDAYVRALMIPKEYPTYVDELSKIDTGVINPVKRSIGIKKEGGKISTEGYKKNSPDKNEPMLTIPSNRITMQDVEHPIMAYPSTGNPTLMHPGGEYYFPHANHVTEVPVAQQGKKIDYTSDYIDGVYNPNAKVMRQLASITPEQMQLMELQRRQMESKIGPAQPRRGKMDKLGAIARNPLTAFGYAVGNQDLPDYFEKGDRNLFDNAIDIVNPMSYYDAAKRTATLENFRNVKGLQDILGALGNTTLDIATLVAAGKITAKQASKLYKTNPIVKEAVDNTIYNIADKASTAIVNSPLKPYYKKAAYNVMSQSGMVQRDWKDVLKQAMKPGNYTGKDYVDILEDIDIVHGTNRKKSKRDLLKLYIYGDETGFQKNALNPIGLEKYEKKYGPLNSYELSFSKTPYYNYTSDAEKIMMDRIEKQIKEKGIYSKGINDLSLKDYVPSDDIAGHMNYIYKTPEGKYKLRIQDLWKFDPEDYGKKWSTNPNIVNQKARLQAMLAEKAGKPFVLSHEHNLNFGDIEEVGGYKRYGGTIKSNWLQNY